MRYEPTNADVRARHMQEPEGYQEWYNKLTIRQYSDGFTKYCIGADAIFGYSLQELDDFYDYFAVTHSEEAKIDHHAFFAMAARLSGK